jgi:hypothetical protein
MSTCDPKMVAEDIAKGLVYLNPVYLNRYTVDDLRAIVGSLSLVQRELRAIHIPVEDLMKLKAKNLQLQHINQAICMINTFLSHKSWGQGAI